MVFLWEVCSESMFQVHPVCRMLLWSLRGLRSQLLLNLGGQKDPLWFLFIVCIIPYWDVKNLHFFFTCFLDCAGYIWVFSASGNKT